MRRCGPPERAAHPIAAVNPEQWHDRVAVNPPPFAQASCFCPSFLRPLAGCLVLGSLFLVGLGVALCGVNEERRTNKPGELPPALLFSAALLSENHTAEGRA